MKKLLLVEDDRDIRHIASLVLRRRFQVAEAADGYAALSLGEAFEPDVVLMDLMMPGLDGFETLLRMRKTDWGAQAVAILMTARTIDEDREITQHGFQAMIAKPFDPLTLDARIEEALA